MDRHLRACRPQARDVVFSFFQVGCCTGGRHAGQYRTAALYGPLGGTAAAWPLAAQAQQASTPVIGFLNSASPRPFTNMVEAFGEGLNSQGLREGRDFRVDYQWAEGQYDKLPALATELVQGGVALITATGGVQSAQAAIKATSTVPILFVIGIDPVQIGMVSEHYWPWAVIWF